jgi:anti-sigma factor RsiW
VIFQRRVHATDDELSAYLDGRLDAGSRDRVGGHVDGCAICRQALDGLRAVQTSLHGLRAKAPRSFALREADVRPARGRAAGRFAGMMPLLSGVTALALIAFFAVVGVDMSGGGSSKSSESLKAQPASINQLAPSVGDASAGAPAADQSLTVTVPASFVSRSVVGTPPEATPQLAPSVSSGTGSDARMHVAEAALAAVALVSGGSAVAVARRRRSA